MTFLITLLLATTILFNTNVEAQTTLTCASWAAHSDVQRAFYVMGFMHGIEVAEQVNGGVAIWPVDHRVGSIEIEMNIECAKPQNAKLQFSEAMMKIMAEKSHGALNYNPAPPPPTGFKMQPVKK